MFEGPFSESIIKRAQQKQLAEIHLHQLRDFTSDKHKKVDRHSFIFLYWAGIVSMACFFLIVSALSCAATYSLHSYTCCVTKLHENITETTQQMTASPQY